MPFRDSSLVRGGKYVLVHTEPVGMGGLGQVYRARDVAIGRDVAVKEVLPTLRPSLRSQAIDKFQHEARLHSTLKHEHIVLARTLEIDPETGEQYLVCDFVAGLSLADRLRWGPLPVESAFRITRELLMALGYLHGRYVIHRDIKPSNILLACDAQGRITQALLADFGIARSLRAACSTIGPGTVPSLTPEYCAPEQVNPALMLDMRADLYSLGLVLGEMLYAEGPYKLMLQLPGRPRAARRSLGPEQRDRRALERIVARATRADPARRYQSAQAFMRDLDQADRRIAARRWVGRELGPALIALSFVLFLMLVPLIAVGNMLEARAPVGQHVADQSVTSLAPTRLPSPTSAPVLAIGEIATIAALLSTPGPTATRAVSAQPTRVMATPSTRPATPSGTAAPSDSTRPTLILVPW